MTDATFVGAQDEQGGFTLLFQAGERRGIGIFLSFDEIRKMFGTTLQALKSVPARDCLPILVEISKKFEEMGLVQKGKS